MKKMMFFMAVLMISLNAKSQDVQKDLLKDVVEVVNNKFVATDFTLLKLSDGTTTFQIKSYAEAPSENVISRDNFVFFFRLLKYDHY